MTGKLKRAVVIGGLAVAALGIGGVAWAATADSAVSASGVAAAAPAATSSAPADSTGTADAKKQAAKKAAGKKAAGDHKIARDLVKRVQHATWVGGGKDGQYVTHQAIKGTVTAVSSSSVTVKAADGFSETFKVDANTKVHVLGDKRAGATGSISQVKAGDKAGVLGTGATGPTATQILIGNGKKATPTTSSSSTTTTG